LVAGSLYGIGSLEQQAVRNGWRAVGILIDESEPGDPGEPSDPGDPVDPGDTGGGCGAALVQFLDTLKGFIEPKGS
jgi:hypothetical protein